MHKHLIFTVEHIQQMLYVFAPDSGNYPCAGRKCSSAPDLCAITSFCATITACKPSPERQAMNLCSLFNLMRQILGSLCQILLQPVRCWTKPDNHAPIPNAALDLARSKSELMLDLSAPSCAST
jgi:hypothetical protein